MNKKTLNEILFEQLDRLSSATEDNIQLEVDKAASIIMVSEQILDVSRLKLQVLQTGVNLKDSFIELDEVKKGELSNK